MTSWIPAVICLWLFCTPQEWTFTVTTFYDEQLPSGYIRTVITSTFQPGPFYSEDSCKAARMAMQQRYTQHDYVLPIMVSITECARKVA